MLHSAHNIRLPTAIQGVANILEVVFRDKFILDLIYIEGGFGNEFLKGSHSIIEMDYEVQLNTPPGITLDTDDYFMIKPKLCLDVNLDHYLNDYGKENQTDIDCAKDYSSYSRSRSPCSPTEVNDNPSQISRSFAPLRSIENFNFRRDDDQNLEGTSASLENASKEQNSYNWSPFTPLSPTVLSNTLPASPFSVQPSEPDYTPYNFLLVDDNTINLLILEKVLNKICPRACTVKVLDSTKVVTILKQQKFDIAFLDIEMPNVSGVDLARHIRKHYQQGIIAVTTRTSVLDLKIYQEAGIDEVFGKPLKGGYDWLMARIKDVIQRHI